MSAGAPAQRRPPATARRPWLHVALALALVLPLAACGAVPGTSPGSASPRPSPTARPPATPRPTRTASPNPTVPSTPRGATTEARVVRVVDGDTIIVAVNGRSVRLRYIGINSPESVTPDVPPEPFGHEAALANERLVGGRTVILERDVSDVDQYGRLLRYVWLNVGGSYVLVNEVLVRQGYAQAATFPPDVRYVALFRAAEREARGAGRGLWGLTPAASPSA